MPNFKPWLWRAVRHILDTIARRHSIQKWPLSKERVGSTEDATSSNQDIKTNGATLACRRGVRGSCIILRYVFLYALHTWKRLCRVVVVFSWLHYLTRRPLMQIIVGLPFGDLSYGVRVFDKFTRATKNSASWPKFTNLSFYGQKSIKFSS